MEIETEEEEQGGLYPRERWRGRDGTAARRGEIGMSEDRLTRV